jgi:hypothetical protein
MALYDGERYCPSCTTYSPNRLTFDAWMRAVDEALIRKVGVSSNDLPDWTYRDAYEDGLTADEAAGAALDAAHGY